MGDATTGESTIRLRSIILLITVTSCHPVLEPSWLLNPISEREAIRAGMTDTARALCWRWMAGPHRHHRAPCFCHPLSPRRITPTSEDR